jgi:hypothetical protein
VQNPALEEGRVHAELQGHGPAESAAQVVDQLAQEGDCLFGVVQSEDVAGLGHVGDQGVVARVPSGDAG